MIWQFFLRFPIGKGIAGHVAETGETLNVADVYMDERFNPGIDEQTGWHNDADGDGDGDGGQADGGGGDDRDVFWWDGWFNPSWSLEFSQVHHKVDPVHANLHTRNHHWSCPDGQQAAWRWCFHQGDPHGGGGGHDGGGDHDGRGDHDGDYHRGHLQEDEDAFRTFAVYCGLALHHAKLYDKIRRSEQKYKVPIW